MPEGFPSPRNRNEKIKAIREKSPRHWSAEEGIQHMGAVISDIFEELRPELERGQYHLIIGVDSGGRIPTLLMSRALTEIYKFENFTLPITRFVAGGASYMSHIPAEFVEKYKRDVVNHTLKQYLKSHSSSGPTSILIVDDIMDTGKTIKDLTDALRRVGFSADVAILHDSSERNPRELPGVRIISKRPGGIGGGLGRESRGVVNQAGTKTFSDAIHDPPLTREDVSETRALIFEEASAIAKNFLQNHTGEKSN